MSATLPVGKSLKCFIVGFGSNGAPGQLQPGQVVSLATDSTDLAIFPDIMPVPPPDGNTSILSATITAGIAATTKTPITITATLKNADGTAISASDTIVIDYSAGAIKSLGIFFGNPF